eukprot:scaffold15117_cov86-Skeletonema_menzelii.AAC.1
MKSDVCSPAPPARPPAATFNFVRLETAGNFEVFVTYGSFVFPVPTLLFPLKSNLGDLADAAKSPKLLLGAAKSPTLLYPSYFEDIHHYIPGLTQLL